MTLRSLIYDTAFVVGVLTVLGLLTVVGISRLRTFARNAADQVQLALPYLLVLGGVLLVNDYLREIGPGISWIVGWRITEDIIALEGTLVADIQGYAHPLLTRYFSYVYIYGYIFLLVFPVLAYFLYTDDGRPVKEIAIAYALNYGIGVVCYLLFIAFGPRNVGIAEELLYTHWPESQLLTRELNANVNVFPSLHASISLTVALLAVRWRTVYRAWTPIATVLALSVVISTMYLGIHWATDVAVGAALAVVSVGIAIWLTSPTRLEGPLGRTGLWIRQLVDRPVEFVIQRGRTWYREQLADGTASDWPASED
jgi:membrane-associated phospholipid phosphatase